MNNEIAFVLPSGKVCLASFDYDPLADFRTAGVTKLSFYDFHFCDIWVPGRYGNLTFMEKVYPGSMAFVLSKQDLDYINTYEYKLPGKKFTSQEVRDAFGVALWGENYKQTQDVEYEEPTKTDDFGFATHSGDFNGDDSE